MTKFFHFIENGVNKKYFFIILFMSMYIMFPYDFFNNIDITKFNRNLGEATAKGIDVSKLINSFNLYFVSVAFLIILGVIIFAAIHLKIKNQQINGIGTTIKNINVLVLISGVMLLMNYIWKYNSEIVVRSILPDLCFWIIVGVILYYFIKGNNKIVLEWNDFKWIMLSSLTTSFTIQIIINAFSFILIFLLVFVILILLADIMKKYNLLYRIKIASIPFHYMVFLICTVSEIYVILNQNNIFIKDGRFLYILCILSIIAFCIYRFFKGKGTLAHWENFSYIGILLSIALLAGIPPISTVVDMDLFEGANFSIPITQFFLFGNIPIIQSQSAHMLSDYAFNMIYKVLNRDITGSFFGIYNGIGISINLIILYYMLKNFFNKDFAIIFVLFFPFYFGSNIFWGSICFVSVLALINLVKKKSTASYYLFWLGLAFSVLYKGDLGMALGLGCIASLIVIIISDGKSIKIKPLILSLLEILLGFIIIYISICFIKGINPIDRAIEFLSIMLKSNQNWAYGVIGNPSLLAFGFAYIIIPITVLIILLHLIWKCHIDFDVDKDNKIRLAILLVLGFSYFINFSRTLVRHSLTESPVAILMFTAMLLIPLYFSYIKNKRVHYFIFALIITMISAEGLSSMKSPTTLSAFDIASQKAKESNTIAKKLGSNKITRVTISDNAKSKYVSIVNEINSLLNDHETFLDFSNQTMLYSLANRKNPVYVSQSPALLSDEFTQEEFIKEIKQSDLEIPIAIMDNSQTNFGVALDGINNTYRYYKVAEYIYQNYKPIEIIGDYEIWYKKGREDIKDKIMKQNSKVNLKDIDFNNMPLTNMNIEKENGYLLCTGKTDPNISGVESIVPEINSTQLEMSIKYTSNVNGILQVYYTTETDPNYKEENSVTTEVKKGNGLATIKVPYRKDIHYRLDIPDNSIFQIKGIFFGNGTAIIDDSYYKEEVHNYELGDIPFLWGNYDSERAYENKTVMDIDTKGKNRIQINSRKLNKKKGNYLLLTINSSENKKINLELGYNQNKKDTKLTNFGFDVKKGEHRYLIRVSTDYYWGTNQYDYIKASLDGNEINKMSILAGD